MSRTRRNLNELDKLIVENKELKATVKALSRDLKKLTKELKIEYNQDDLIKEDLESKEPKKVLCERCARGHIVVTKLGIKSMQNCTVCDYRKLIK